jgi:hypothetical protein
MIKTLISLLIFSPFLSEGAKNIDTKDSTIKKNKFAFYLAIEASYGNLNGKPPKNLDSKYNIHKKFYTKTQVYTIGIEAKLLKNIKRVSLGGSINCNFAHFSRFSEVSFTDSLQNKFRSDNIYSYKALMVVPCLYGGFSFKFKNSEFRPYVQPGILFDLYFSNGSSYSSYSEDWLLNTGRYSALSLKFTSGLEIVIKRFVAGANYSYYKFPRVPQIVRLNMITAGLHLGYKF